MANKTWQLDTPMVAGIITVAALVALIALSRGFRGVSVSVG